MRKLTQNNLNKTWTLLQTIYMQHLVEDVLWVDRNYFPFRSTRVHPRFSVVQADQYLGLCIVFCRLLFVVFSFSHYIVSLLQFTTSDIMLWHLQHFRTLLKREDAVWVVIYTTARRRYQCIIDKVLNRSSRIVLKTTPCFVYEHETWHCPKWKQLFIPVTFNKMKTKDTTLSG